jgi:hypothetical protein
MPFIFIFIPPMAEMKRDRKLEWGEIPRFTPGDVGKNYGFSRRTSRVPIDSS